MGNAEVLQDAHWVGGDPARGEIYGYGSFACPPCRGILSLRNPQAVAQQHEFTLRQVLEVPKSWPGGVGGALWHVRRLWPAPVTTEAPVAAIAEPGSTQEPGHAVRRLSEGTLPNSTGWRGVTLDQLLAHDLAALDFQAFEAIPLPL